MHTVQQINQQNNQSGHSPEEKLWAAFLFGSPLVGMS